MKSIMALAIVLGLTMAAPAVVYAGDDGSISSSASEVDLKAKGGAARFFQQLELNGGSGG